MLLKAGISLDTVHPSGACFRGCGQVSGHPCAASRLRALLADSSLAAPCVSFCCTYTPFLYLLPALLTSGMAGLGPSSTTFNLGALHLFLKGLFQGLKIHMLKPCQNFKLAQCFLENSYLVFITINCFLLFFQLVLLTFSYLL